MSAMTIEDLYQEYAPPLYRYLLRKTGDHERTKDLLQDTFLKAAKAFPTLKQRQRLQAWLFRIARNTFIDDYRRRKCLSFQSLDAAIGTAEEPRGEDPCLPFIEEREGRELYQQAFALLSRNHQQALQRWQEWQASGRRRVGGTTVAQKMMEHRAREQFKRLYRELSEVG